MSEMIIEQGFIISANNGVVQCIRTVPTRTIAIFTHCTISNTIPALPDGIEDQKQ